MVAVVSAFIDDCIENKIESNWVFGDKLYWLVALCSHTGVYVIDRDKQATKTAKLGALRTP